MATTRNPSKTKTGNGSFARFDGKDNFPKERELIMVAKRDVGLRVAGEGLTSAEGANVKPLSDLLAAEGAEMAPLFGLSEERLKAEAAALAPSSEMEVPDLSILYHVRAEDEKLDKLCKALCELDFVDGAYVKPAGEPPEVLVEDTIETVNDMLPIGDEAPPATANLSTRQGYLDPAPGGIDARYAWTIAGGRGAGIRIIDCEWGWRFTHEDLLQNQMGVVFGSSSSNDNHGTAVLGEISGDRNAFGVLGIAPDAIVGAASFVSSPSAQTIRQAANRLNAGDIILLEIHRPGPRATGVGQQGFIAIEWWYDDFLAIRYAASRGIIVVEAAGNGAQNFDDAIYDVRPAGFPAAWRNPFNPGNPSSGAVVVGAGAPPPGTHGRNHGPDRSRLGFSNYGRRVDVQGWGREVTTTGYGDLQGGGNRDFWYTDTFSGTSSASPIVVGALACVQGVLRAQGGTLLTPASARTLLRTTGSPQQDAPTRPSTQRIGTRPNLRQMIQSATKVWYTNRTITRTFASPHSQNVYVHIAGLGWRKIKPIGPDGVTNMLIAACEAFVNNQRVNVYADSTFIHQMYVI